MAESELAVLAAQCLDRRIPDRPTLEAEVAAWVQRCNSHHAKADWRFTTADARIKLKNLYPSLQVIQATRIVSLAKAFRRDNPGSRGDISVPQLSLAIEDNPRVEPRSIVNRHGDPKEHTQRRNAGCLVHARVPLPAAPVLRG